MAPRCYYPKADVNASTTQRAWRLRRHRCVVVWSTVRLLILRHSNDEFWGRGTVGYYFDKPLTLRMGRGRCASGVAGRGGSALDVS
jgi:hypothetical protein